MTDEQEDGRRGPDPSRLKIDENDWREAVRKALKGPKRADESPPEGDAGDYEDSGDGPMDDGT